MQKIALITGANRGLGLEFVKQYLKNDFKVIACTRDIESSKDLKKVAEENSNLVIEKLDISLEEDISKLSNKLKNTHIDILINNAGTYLGRFNSFESTSNQDTLNSVLINALGPIKLIEALVDNVAKSNLKTIVSISSKMGSIGDNTSGGAYSYRIGKAALNMAMKSISIDVAEKGIKTMILHPGWVQTRMGGENALINSETSVQGMMKIIAEKSEVNNLKFYAYDGKEIPW